MKKPKVTKPEKEPEKIWEGYINLRSLKTIKEEKKKFNWNKFEEEKEEQKKWTDPTQENYMKEKYCGEVINAFFTSSEETMIEEDTSALNESPESNHPEEEQEFYDCFSTNQPNDKKAVEQTEQETLKDERINQMKADNTNAKTPTLNTGYLSPEQGEHPYECKQM